ncbi:hypothetical protein Tco_1226504 [Tanacetum coccineum]
MKRKCGKQYVNVVGIKPRDQTDLISSSLKKTWKFIKTELLRVIEWFWESMEISKGCNASFVTLIPKVADPIGLGDFRPISLIGCYYKIITKMLAEMVKRVVGNVGGSSERIHKRSASMSILVNGSPSMEFGLERGVRQGDPLSPILFLLAAEGLNVIVTKAVEKGIFREHETGECMGSRGGKIQKRLADWKAKTMSFRDRLTLVKSVLVLASFGDGGLNIGSLRAKNLAVLVEGWVMLGHWVRVSGGGVWSDIVRIGKEIDRMGLDFSSSCFEVFGDGKDIRFWVDRWVDNRRLCDRFPRLYHLDRRKEGSV